ncbi:MAG: radical SAM protein [Syntrophales bacterium]|nr:radical SAM protein [Syntrophales bacterium]
MRIAVFNVSSRFSSDGSRLISALLKRDGHQVTGIHLARVEPIPYDNEELEMLGEILRGTDLVMISIQSTFAFRAVQITEFVHRKFPGLKVIWGGPHCISAPELSIPYADGVCFSEGDETVVELARKMEAGEEYFNIPNMAFRRNGEVIKNSVLPPFSDLDGLPFCDYETENLFLLDKGLFPITKDLLRLRFVGYPYYIPSLFVLTARGCPYNCSYCNNARYITLFKSNKLRFQSAERAVAELEYTLNKLDFVEFVGLGDDDFFARSEREIEEFSAKYKKRVGLPFMIAGSANAFTRKKMEILLDAGLKVIQMGVQSGSERVLHDVYNRRIKLSRIKEAIDVIAPYKESNDLDLLVDFIIDNPYETKDDIVETYRFILDLPPKVKLNILTLAFFPGTPIYERALQDRFIQPFSYDSFRLFTRSRIGYQNNYEMFLVLLARYLRHNAVRTGLLMRLAGTRLVRLLASLIPASVIAYLSKAVQKGMGRPLEPKKQ